MLVVTTGLWPGLQQPRLWVVPAAEAAATKLLPTAAEVVVAAVKAMTVGRVVVAASEIMVVVVKVVAGRSRLRQPRSRRRRLWPQRPRCCLWTQGHDSNRGLG